jgi:TolA-binding protein
LAIAWFPTYRFRAIVPSVIVIGLAFCLAASPGFGQESATREVPKRLNFANGLFHQRKYALAAEEYEAFLETARPGPFADDARFGLANARHLLGQYAKARDGFESFLKAAPNHANAPAAWYRIGEAAYVLGDLQGARKALETYTTRYPQHRFNESALTFLGDACFRQGDLPRAREAYEKALNDFPSGRLAPRARLGLGRTLADQREFEPALKVLNDLAEHGGADWADKAWFQIGRVQAAAGRPNDAVAAFETLERDTPRSPLVPESRLRRAEALIKLDRFDDAEKLLADLASGNSENLAAQAAFVLGSAELKRDQAARAFTILDEAYKRFPRAPIAPALLFRSAEAKLKLADAVEARARFLRVADESPDDPWADDALLQAAKLALEQRDPAGARTIANTLAEKFPRSPLRTDADRIAEDAQFLAAQELMEKKEFAGAIPMLEAYLGANGDSRYADYALAHLAQARLETGKVDDAWKALEQLAQRFPESKVLVGARHRLASAALNAKQYDRAIEQFRLAAGSSDPATRTKAQLGLGWALLDGGKPAEAADAFAALVEHAPDDLLAPEAALAQGRALERAHQIEPALAAYGKAVEKYPRTPQARSAALARARLLVDAKRPADAAAAYEQFLKDYPDSPRGNDGDGADSLLSEWGWALVDADKPADADRVFERLLHDYPESPHAADARFNLAESAQKAQRYDEVIKFLQPLVAEGAKTPPTLLEPALYRLGRTQAERKDWPAATKALDRLLHDYPDSRYKREARYLHAEALLRSNDPRTAEAEFAALAAEPPVATDPKGFAHAVGRQRIECLLALKRWKDVIEAAEAFKQAAPDDPLTAEVEYARGRALQSQTPARFEEARAAYDAVIAARKGGDLAARAQLMRGETYFHEKKYREALREFLQVDVLYEAPVWEAAALLEAGKVYEQLAQWADAAETYERLRGEWPGDPATEEAKAEAKARLEAVRKHLETAPAAQK